MIIIYSRSGREEDSLILETMAKIVQDQGKFKKGAVFAAVQQSELPIDTKGFDATLRRYCYSLKQFWNGSKFYQPLVIWAHA